MDREEERAWTQPWDTAGLWMKEQKLESLGDEKGEQVLGRSKLSFKKNHLEILQKEKAHFCPIGVFWD